MDNQYRCIVKMDGRNPCHHSTWGQTPYCFWHYSFVQWRLLLLWMKPQSRSVIEAIRNPDTITDWTTPGWVSTSLILGFMFFHVLFVFIFAAAGLSGQTTLVESIASMLVINGYVIALAMMVGNSNVLMPKIFFVHVIALMCLSIGVIITKPSAPTQFWGTSRLISSVGIILFVFPKPFTELGVSRLGFLGLFLVLLGGIMGNFTGGAGTAPNTNSSFSDMLGQIQVAAGVAFFVSIVFATVGGFLAVNAISSKVKTETVFYRCIRPAQVKVMYVGAFIGWLASAVVGYTLLNILFISGVAGFALTQLVAATVSTFATRKYGLNVFNNNLRKAGLSSYDDDLYRRS